MNNLSAARKRYRIGSLAYCARANRKFEIKKISTSSTDMKSISGTATGKVRYLYDARSGKWAMES